MITPSNLSSTPLIANSSGLPLLEGVGATNLTLSGVDLTLRGDYLDGLTVEGGSQIVLVDSTLSHINILDSKVTVIGSTVNGGGVGVSLTDSNLTVLSTTFNNLTYAYNPLNSTIQSVDNTYSGVSNISTLPTPTFKLTTPTTITGTLTRIKLVVTGFSA
jgi:hypothetical protein